MNALRFLHDGGKQKDHRDPCLHLVLGAGVGEGTDVHETFRVDKGEQKSLCDKQIRTSDASKEEKMHDIPKNADPGSTTQWKWSFGNSFM
jgi:hypothetical protein